MKKAKDILMFVIAGLVTVLFIGVLGILIFVEIPAESSNLVYTFGGIVGTGWITIINYFFGSSKGSADKNDIIAKNGHG